MKYRDIEYTVVQGIMPGVWKWSASVAGVVIMGQAAVKSEAVAAAEKSIDRALALKNVRLVPPDTAIDSRRLPQRQVLVPKF
jgi:hypothetical protein